MLLCAGGEHILIDSPPFSFECQTLLIKTTQPCKPGQPGNQAHTNMCIENFSVSITYHSTCNMYHIIKGNTVGCVYMTYFIIETSPIKIQFTVPPALDHQSFSPSGETHGMTL